MTSVPNGKRGGRTGILIGQSTLLPEPKSYTHFARFKQQAHSHTKMLAWPLLLAN